MTIKTIDQQRFDELTEWCRNRPEDAAARIAIAEGWEGTYPGPIPRSRLPNFHVANRAYDQSGFVYLDCRVESRNDIDAFMAHLENDRIIEIDGAPCKIVHVSTKQLRFDATTVRAMP